MREKLEFPEHEEINFEQTQMNDEFKGELGASALKDEIEVLTNQHEQENAAADEQFLQAYNNRKWWRTSAPHKDEVSGWSKGRHGTASPILAERRAHHKQDEAWSKEQFALSDAKIRLAGIRKVMDDLSDTERKSMNRNLDDRLRDYAKTSGGDYDKLAFVQWKNQAATDAGKTLTWTDWLRRPADRTEQEFTTEERQMLNFLQWNQHYYNAVNSDPAVRKDFENRSHQFSEDLDALVENGVLDPKIQANNLARPMRITIGEPVDTALLKAYGYAETYRPNIVLRPHFEQGTYVHERMHPLGEMGDRYWNEAATQYLADEINILHKRDLHDSAYESSINTLASIIDAARMTAREFSEYFATEDYSGFMEEIKKRTGLDVDGAYQAIKEKAHETYPDNTQMFNLYIEYHMETTLKTVLRARRQQTS